MKVDAIQVLANVGSTLATRLAIAGLNLLLIPWLLTALGLELYGVLTITWMVVGQLAWLDFGLSRATTRFVSRELTTGNEVGAAQYITAALLMQSGIAAVGACGLYVLAPYLAGTLRVTMENRGAVVLCIRTLAISLPFDVASGAASGGLEARQRIHELNAIDFTAKLLTLGAFAVGIVRGGDLRAIVLGLLFVKVVQFLLLMALASHSFPELRLTAMSRNGWPSQARMGEMLRYGGWVAACTVLHPLLLYVDRWLIGWLLGVAMLPYYTIPYQVLEKLRLLPKSLVRALFPALSALEAAHRWEKVRWYFCRSHRYLATVTVPIIGLLFIWCPQLLRGWLGAGFPELGTTPMRIFLLGFLFGVINPLAGSLLFAGGRPDLAGRIYLVDIPANALLLVILTPSLGLPGAALAWAIRTAGEVAAMWWLERVAFGVSPAELIQLMRPALLLGLGIWLPVVAFALRPGANATELAALSLGGCLAYAAGVWRWGIDRHDRQLMSRIRGEFLPQ